MKAQDLMIGDWVRMKESPDLKFQMEDVSGTGMFKRWSQDGEIMIPFSYSEIEPIPLTREILEKNGFEKLDFSHYHIKGRTLVLDADGKWEGELVWHWVVTEMDTNSKGQNYVIDYYVATIQYVHQLQHALRLCGIDLEIKL